MTATFDANLLLHASDSESDFHPRAVEVLQERAMGPENPLPVLARPDGLPSHRHPPDGIRQPASVQGCGGQRRGAARPPKCPGAGEDDGFWALYRAVSSDAGARGNLVPDAHLVALMHQYGVRTIISHDRDFKKFDGIRVEDPFA